MVKRLEVPTYIVCFASWIMMKKSTFLKQKWKLFALYLAADDRIDFPKKSDLTLDFECFRKNKYFSQFVAFTTTLRL